LICAAHDTGEKRNPRFHFKLGRFVNENIFSLLFIVAGVKVENGGLFLSGEIEVFSAIFNENLKPADRYNAPIRSLSNS
jgi:hypothetical protein